MTGTQKIQRVERRFAVGLVMLWVVLFIIVLGLAGNDEREQRENPPMIEPARQQQLGSDLLRYRNELNSVQLAEVVR